MPQMLLFPDPRPLVERLGRQFFLDAPECPGVYLMRDSAEAVLYVGKAKNLRKRLASYRVANPDRLPRRHLRLLRSVTRIELQPCADEAAALARESELLLELHPRFNRAGTWPAPPRFIAWRLVQPAVELAVKSSAESGWCSFGPLGTSAALLRAALARLLWCAIDPARGLAGLPEGWFRGIHQETTIIPIPGDREGQLRDLEILLQSVFHGQPDPLVDWIHQRTGSWSHPFETAVRDADLEMISQFASKADKLKASDSKVEG